MKVLVVGSGGREHAIVKSLNRSKRVKKVFAAPGNPGMATDSILLDFEEFEDVYQLVVSYSIDLVIIGPEQYLCDGLADYLEERGVAVIGVSKEAARLESSKAFAKDFMHRHQIPTAKYAAFNSYEKALDYLNKASYPLVIKADGLAAGKGVMICQDTEEAKESLYEIMKCEIFGNAGQKVVIEEYLDGWEASIFAFIDGKNYKLTLVSQDHKKALDGDKGLNTGGMGAYAPLEQANPFLDVIDKKIFAPLMKGLRKESIEYKGILYVGLMFTEKGPFVLEFNCRLGDPETQAVLPLLKTDFIDICEAITKETMKDLIIEWRDLFSVNVVVASEGYPGKYQKGKVISIDPEIEKLSDLDIYYANVLEDKSKKSLLTAGGRVLSVTALAPDLPEAIAKAYNAVELIKFENKYYRKDIGKKGIRL